MDQDDDQGVAHDREDHVFYRRIVENVTRVLRTNEIEEEQAEEPIDWGEEVQVEPGGQKESRREGKVQQESVGLFDHWICGFEEVLWAFFIYIRFFKVF